VEGRVAAMKIKCPTCEILLAKLDLADIRVGMRFAISCYKCKSWVISELGTEEDSDLDSEVKIVVSDRSDRGNLEDLR